MFKILNEYIKYILNLNQAFKTTGYFPYTGILSSLAVGISFRKKKLYLALKSTICSTILFLTKHIYKKKIKKKCMCVYVLSGCYILNTKLN